MAEETNLKWGADVVGWFDMAQLVDEETEKRARRS
jgi:hypothetical protein